MQFLSSQSCESSRVIPTADINCGDARLRERSLLYISHRGDSHELAIMHHDEAFARGSWSRRPYDFKASRRSVASTSRIGRSRDCASNVGLLEAENRPDIRLMVMYSPSIFLSAAK